MHIGHGDYCLCKNCFEQRQNKSVSNFKYTFNENEYLAEIGEYIKNTYKQHYIGGSEEKTTQTTERIIQNGHGTGFCMGNVTKYADRYGKKNGFQRNDLLKLIHYAVIQLYIHDKEKLGEKST